MNGDGPGHEEAEYEEEDDLDDEEDDEDENGPEYEEDDDDDEDEDDEDEEETEYEEDEPDDGDKPAPLKTSGPASRGPLPWKRPPWRVSAREFPSTAGWSSTSRPE